MQSLHDKLRVLTSQKSENESVLKEFNALEEEANIWKLTGPLLVKQEKEDAHANVEKRLEFIISELSKVDENIKKQESAFETKRQELSKIQSELKQFSSSTTTTSVA